ncbi:MAG: PD40 domain-containing protein [Gemmatimonadetes bacterium]|nr:PD40 domain-containing protein [Gemmatimonadota bacterium]
MKLTAALLLLSLAVLWGLRDGITRSEAPSEATSATSSMVTDTIPTPVDTPRIVSRRLWAVENVDPWGAISPDGRFFTFTDWNTGNLAVRDLVNGTTRSLTNKKTWTDPLSAYALGSVFSPDGRKIAYAWIKSGESYTELRVTGVDGSEPRVLLRNREVGYIDPAQWSPDGASILAEFGIAGGVKIALVSVADGAVRALKTHDWGSSEETATKFSTMTLSPNGEYVAYNRPARGNHRDRDIFVLASDGSRETPLVQHPADDALLGWTPDGKHILFASDRAGTPSAWIIPVSGGRGAGEPRLIKADLWRISPIGFSRNGSFYYAVDVAGRDVYVADVDLGRGKLRGTPTRLVQRFVGRNGNPDWSPDGKYLAYLSGRAPGLTADLIIRSMESGDERVLAPKLRSAWRPRWSPDGRFILVTAVEDKGGGGGNAFHLIDAQTGAARVVVRPPPDGYVQWPTWSRDGRQLFYYKRTEKTKHGLYALVLQTGEERQIYEGGEINELVASPDGRWLAFGAGDRSDALTEIPVTGGPARVLLQLKAGEDAMPLAWTRHGLLYRSAKRLWRLPPEGGTPMKLELGEQVDWFPYWALSLHPDGTRIAFSAGEAFGLELWVMENFLPEPAR